MARRRIGQERLAMVSAAGLRGGRSLDELVALIDWPELDRMLAGISAPTKGESGWPLLALFRALLLSTWHDLSCVRLTEASDDRASFRRFCGFATHEPTPERTAFVRFRAALLCGGLDRALFEPVTRQLDARCRGPHRHAGGRRPDPVGQRQARQGGALAELPKVTAA